MPVSGIVSFTARTMTSDYPGFNHGVGHCPLDCSHDLRRPRPCKIGAPADVATAQRMYSFITSPMRKPRREIMRLAYHLGYLSPISTMSESLQASCLQC